MVYGVEWDSETCGCVDGDLGSEPWLVLGASWESAAISGNVMIRSVQICPNPISPSHSQRSSHLLCPNMGDPSFIRTIDHFQPFSQVKNRYPLSNGVHLSMTRSESDTLSSRDLGESSKGRSSEHRHGVSVLYEYVQ